MKKRFITSNNRIKVQQYIRHIFLILILSSLAIASVGQDAKTLLFNGYQQWFYQKPMMMPSGKWDAYYESNDRIDISGKILVNEKTKTLSVVFVNGESWNAKIIKKEIVQEKSGADVQTIYRGIWVDNQMIMKLVETSTWTNGCEIKLYSRQITDTGLVINGKEVKFDDFECYKIVTLFFASRKCFE